MGEVVHEYKDKELFYFILNKNGSNKRVFHVFNDNHFNKSEDCTNHFSYWMVRKHRLFGCHETAGEESAE